MGVSKKVFIGVATALLIAAFGYVGNWLTSGGLVHLLGGVTRSEMDEAVRQARNRIHNTSDQRLYALETPSTLECFDSLETAVKTLGLDYEKNEPTFLFLHSDQYFIGFACNNIEGRIFINGYYTANDLYRGAPREIVETVVGAVAG